jgi:hypothetical protein
MTPPFSALGARWGLILTWAFTRLLEPFRQRRGALRPLLHRPAQRRVADLRGALPLDMCQRAAGTSDGLEWKCLDMEKGVIAVTRQFTHGAWSELKTANSRRRIPLARELLLQLKVRGPLLTKTGPDDEHPDRVAVAGKFHMLRHFFVTALIQSGVNAKVAQTLAGHHSASFTLDQYADAIPEQLEEAGEKVATVLLQASGSKTVAVAKTAERMTAQVIEINGAPGEIRTPDLLVRSQALYPTELRARACECAAESQGCPELN